MSLINLGGYPKKIKFFKARKSSKYKTVYKYEFDEKYGCPRRVANGQMDLDAMIQQYADDVDFKAIGQMLVDTRDNVISHFTDANGEIIDITGQPRDIHEMNALHNKMMAEYEKLPDELKTLFGSSFDGFSKSYKEGKIGQVMETYYKSLESTGTTDSNTEGGAE